MRANKLALLGLPSAAGGRVPGLIRAPQALRRAGLIESLRAVGAHVVDLGDLPCFPLREDREHPRARNSNAVAQAAGTVALGMTRALGEGFALILGGDCSLVVGTLAGASGHFERAVGLVYLDADADLNTEQTSPSGFMDGMALALALGHGPSGVVAAGGSAPAVAAGHVMLMGFRGLDVGERDLVHALAGAIPAGEIKRIGAPSAADRALEAIANQQGPVLVHLDVDLLDPDEMPVKTALPGPGLSFDEACNMLSALLASPRVVALEFCEYDPDRDPDGRWARRLIDLIARVWSARFRTRKASL